MSMCCCLLVLCCPGRYVLLACMALTAVHVCISSMPLVMQAVLLEGRAWQSRAAAVLQQPSVVAAAAAAVLADPCASVCSLWNTDIAAAAALEMKELDALIGKRGTGGRVCG